MDEKGAPVLVLTTSSGTEITDQTLIRKVKKSDRYKENVEKLIADKKREVEEQTKKFISISKFTPIVVDEASVLESLNKLIPKTYTTKDYIADCFRKVPTIEMVRTELISEAKQKINKIFFWKNNKLREEYVAERLDSRFNQKLAAWENDKDAFEKQEVENKVKIDKEFL